MSYKLIVRKLYVNEKKFVVDSELKGYCKQLSLDYLSTIKYLIRNRHLLRIFKGIFYVYSIEERKFGKSEMTFYEILKESLKLKGVDHWYFGLETGLKFNNLTHEYFTVDYIINDKIFRAKPINIMGRRVKFYKLIPKMFSFGIVNNGLNYSDSEKTMLDLFYLNHYSKSEFEEFSSRLSPIKLLKYSKNYDKRTENLVRSLNVK